MVSSSQEAPLAAGIMEKDIIAGIIVESMVAGMVIVIAENMYLISVYFDKKANNILQRYMETISQATGNMFMLDKKVSPHMTILAIEARSVEELRQPFLSVCGKLAAGKFVVASVGQFLPYVFYATPVLNNYLYTLSNTLYDAVKGLPNACVSKFYRPGSWLPHVTLAKTLDKEQMRQAFSAMQQHFQPFEVEVTKIGLAKVNPHEDVELLPLPSGRYGQDSEVKE